MSWRALALVVALLALPVAASAQAAARADGATIDPVTRTLLTVAPSTRVSFVDMHSARVAHDLMLFKPTFLGISPLAPQSVARVLARPPLKNRLRFVAPIDGGDALEVRRDRDRLVLFRGPQSRGSALTFGLAMFAATTLLSAHAPRPLRGFFDGAIHFGPAIFDGGGMGAGVGGRFL